jgi:hypothetical protein
MYMDTNIFEESAASTLWVKSTLNMEAAFPPKH